MRATPIEINWHNGFSIYASESFLKGISDEYGWLGGTDNFGKLVCILPYSVISKSVFRLVRFPTQTILLDGDLDIEEEKGFLNSAVEYFRNIKVDVIIPATVNSAFRTYPDGAVAAPYGRYILNLKEEEDTLWKNLHSKHRNVIRNAKKKNVQIRSGIEYLETTYDLVKDSFMRSADGFMGRMRVSTRMDYDVFKRQILGLGENVKVFVAEHEGRIQSCAVIPFSKHSAYYAHGGGISNPLTGAMNLLQWEAICQFREIGVHRYDFCGARINPESGSKAEGISRFKERFGVQLTQGYMWKYALHPVKYFLYSIAVRIRSGGDVVNQEQHKLIS